MDLGVRERGEKAYSFELYGEGEALIKAAKMQGDGKGMEKSHHENFWMMASSQVWSSLLPPHPHYNSKLPTLFNPTPSISPLSLPTLNPRNPHSLPPSHIYTL